MNSRVLAIACSIAPCFAWAPAAARPAVAVAPEETSLEQARQWYREGLSLEAAGDWAAALRRFERVAEVRLTAQVRFHIARNKEQLGRWTEALGDYQLAEYQAREDGATELPIIFEARRALESRIPKLVLRLGDGAKGGEVEVDRVGVGARRLGVPLPVDPGTHHIVVSMPSGHRFERVVDVTEGELETLTLDPPDGLGDEPPTATPRVIEQSAPVWPWIVAGVGTVAMGASGVFYYLKEDARLELEEACNGRSCPEEYRSTYDDGRAYSFLAPIAFGVGATALTAAAIGWIWGGSAQPVATDGASLRVGVELSGQSSGVSLSGPF